MGNQLQKQYNLKNKPLKLPGAYSFLRFSHHPTQLSSSIILIKSPHLATPHQSTLILPIKQLKPLTPSNDLIAICSKCLPLSLILPESQTEIKILMYKILKINSQIGRCFISQGRILVWCQQKRSLSSMSPQQVQYGKINQKSKIFTSAITLLNFLYCINQNENQNQKNHKEFKDKKNKKNKQQKIFKMNQTTRDIPISISMSNNNNNNKLTLYNNNQLNLTKNTQKQLPTEIKLFFNPKDIKEYFSTLKTLQNRLLISSFWPQISQGLRQLIMNMLSYDPSQRIDLQTILNIPYFQQCQQLKLYFILCDEIVNMNNKQMIGFMKMLEIIIKQGVVFQKNVLDNYIVPVLVGMVQSGTMGDTKKLSSINNNHNNTNNNTNNNNNSNNHNNIKSNPKASQSAIILATKSLSILIQVTNPPINIIYNVLKNSSVTNKSMILLCMQKKQKLFYLLQQSRFESALSRMLFCCYQFKYIKNADSRQKVPKKQINSNQYLDQIQEQEIPILMIGIMSTPFMMRSVKQMNIKRQIQLKLINKILSLLMLGELGQKHQKLLINCLKCVIQLLKSNLIININKYMQIKFQSVIIMKLTLQTNIHILYFYGLLTNYIPTKLLISSIMSKLDPYLSEVLVSNELFTTAYSLSRKILMKLSQNRKIKPQNDQINLQYSQQYFQLKDQYQQNNKNILKQIQIIKNYIQINQIHKLQWIAKDLL